MSSRIRHFCRTLANDVEVSALLKEERRRQLENIELIASENFTSSAVISTLGSVLTNKYSEGYPKEDRSFQYLSFARHGRD